MFTVSYSCKLIVSQQNFPLCTATLVRDSYSLSRLSLCIKCPLHSRGQLLRMALGWTTPLGSCSPGFARGSLLYALGEGSCKTRRTCIDDAVVCLWQAAGQDCTSIQNWARCVASLEMYTFSAARIGCRHLVWTIFEHSGASASSKSANTSGFPAYYVPAVLLVLELRCMSQELGLVADFDEGGHTQGGAAHALAE